MSADQKMATQPTTSISIVQAGSFAPPIKAPTERKRDIGAGVSTAEQKTSPAAQTTISTQSLPVRPPVVLSPIRIRFGYALALRYSLLISIYLQSNRPASERVASHVFE